MLRTLTTTSTNTASSILPHPNLTAAFSSPFTRSSLTAIRAALSRDHSPVAVDPKEKHAAVLIPLCNVNDQPGILLELRGKLRTHSDEVRYATRRIAVSLIERNVSSLAPADPDGAHVCSFPGGRVDHVCDPRSTLVPRPLSEQLACGDCGLLARAITWLTRKCFI
jgi:hypothetical protein